MAPVSQANSRTIRRWNDEERGVFGLCCKEAFSIERITRGTREPTEGFGERKKTAGSVVFRVFGANEHRAEREHGSQLSDRYLAKLKVGRRERRGEGVGEVGKRVGRRDVSKGSDLTEGLLQQSSPLPDEQVRFMEGVPAVGRQGRFVQDRRHDQDEGAARFQVPPQLSERPCRIVQML